MKTNEMIAHVKAFYQKNVDLLEKKNKDYSGSEDAFKAFKLTEELGITTVEKGMLVRMGDKMQRLATLLNADKVNVNDEGIIDTIADIAGYAALMSAYISEKNDKQVKKK